MFAIDSKHNYSIVEYNKAWRYTTPNGGVKLKQPDKKMTQCFGYIAVYRQTFKSLGGYQTIRFLISA
jgi:hypothetical protein